MLLLSLKLAIMSATSKSCIAKQSASHASAQSSAKDSGSSSELPTETAKALLGFAELQAALQKAMEELSRFNGTLLALQRDVTSVKTNQGKMKADVASIFQRLSETEGRISELEYERDS